MAKEIGKRGFDVITKVMAGKEAVKEIIGMSKQGFDAINKALNLYSQVLDEIIPWKMYEDKLRELHRFRQDYSNESAQLIGEVQALIKEAQLKYFGVTQSIYEWCSLILHILQIYMDLFRKRTSETYGEQRAYLIQMLTDGFVKMSAGNSELEQSSTHFNNAAKKLKSLNTQLTKDFDTKSSYFQGKVNKMLEEANGDMASGFALGPFATVIPYTFGVPVVEAHLVPDLKKKCDLVKDFYEKLHTTIAKTNTDMDSIEDNLSDELKNINKLKVQTEDTKALIPMDELEELRNAISESVNKLIKACNVYQKHHGRKN